MSKRTQGKQAEPPVRLTARAVAYLHQEARAAVAGQSTTAARYDRSALHLFTLSAALIAASAILGHLELASSNVGLLSWIALAVTLTAWLAAALGARRPLPSPEDPPHAAAPDRYRRRHLRALALEAARSDRGRNDQALRDQRRWLLAVTQLVALQTALIVAVELAARG
ncbi:MAG: hypothetical protein O3A76_10215 [Chloroflexi bacterium]|nr:hypothetical protein [Chloroflexota bacterium]